MAEQFADKIFLGGDILTMDEKTPKVEALAVTGEHITAVGALDEVLKLAGPDTLLINLENQALLPGFIEPHSHAITAARFRSFIDISGYYYRSYSEVETRMKQEIAKVDTEVDPVEWCVFSGWDPELIADLPSLDADFLDKEFSDRVPIVVIAQNLHSGWANHRALQIAGVDNSVKDTATAVYGRKADGALTGELYEPTAVFGIIDARPRPTSEQLREIVRSQWMEYASKGFTTVTDIAYMPNKPLDDMVVEHCKTDTCPLRLALYSLIHGKDELGEIGPIAEPCGTLWEAGIKIISDGSPHCGTAAVREPYLDNDVTRLLGFPSAHPLGILLLPSQDLYDMVRFYHDKGRQVAIHAHGERTIDQVLDVYEKILTESPSNIRHRIEHLGFGTEDQIARAGKLNLALSFFVDHLYFYAKSYTKNILGPERTKRWAPLSLATKHGLTWTIHQDQPAYPGPPRPFGNMKTAVMRTDRDDDETVYGAEYRVSIHEALKAYTINAAWQIHRDDQLGSLAVNKKADLVILSHNPYRVEPRCLEDIKVLDTFIGGRSNKLSPTRTTVLRDGRNATVYSGKRKASD